MGQSHVGYGGAGKMNGESEDVKYVVTKEWNGRSSWSGSNLDISPMMDSIVQPCNFRKHAMIRLVCDVPSLSAM